MTVWESQAFGREELLGVDLFVILFALDNSNSLAAAIGPYYNTIIQNYPFAQMLLIGTKADLREDESERLIVHKEASDAALGIRARHYIEIDTQSTTQVSELLQTIAEICCGAFQKPRRKHAGDRMQTCNIM